MSEGDAHEDAERQIDVMRQQFRPLSYGEKSLILQVKQAGAQFHAMIDHLGASRETALAKTKIEEAVMWAVKAITE